jgi:lipopolysaccharide export system protein LptA
VTARRSSLRGLPLIAVTIAAAMLVVTAPGLAQSEKKSPGLFKAPAQMRDEPVRIASLSLEVRDRAKLATFSGNVHIIQGDLDLRSNTLLVFYADDKGTSGAKQATAGTGGNQQIRRMEARGSVVITRNDQRATADHAEYDVLKNMLTMNGNVVVTRCEDVMRGERLVVNMTTGVSRMEGRIEGVLIPKSRDGGC